MKRVLAIQICLLFTLAGASMSESLSEEYQQDLLERMNFIRGAGSRPASLDTVELPHCGTNIAFEFFINRPNLSEEFQMAAKAMARPPLPSAYVSPAQRFLIHYTTSGGDAVYQSGVDVSPADGVPDYVNRIGEITDSVYQFIIGRLGYPAPPRDDFYPDGGDSLYDVYVQNLGTTLYGYTQGEVAIGTQSATSYLVLDNDYNFAPYNTRPLDAVRVTVAHEFFHAVHFGMDYTEYEGASAAEARLYWWEMSSTWMEEMAYDGINDYYGYLKAFYDYPWLSLQDFSIGNALHPYGAAVFPIFLSERFDTSIVRSIWERCRDYGTGAQFLQATNDAIVEASGGEYDLGRAFAEFSIWNLFTGARSVRAPTGYIYIDDPNADTVTTNIGFSEAANYPMIPDSAFIPHTTYPFMMIWPWPSSTSDISASKMSYYKARVPQNLGSNYIALNNLGPADDTVIYRFAGFRNPSLQLVWHSSLIGMPITPSEPAVAIIHKQPSTAVIDSIFTLGNFRFYAIPSLTSVLNSAYIDGATGHPFGYLVLDTLIIEPEGPSGLQFIIAPPYPNPMVVNSADDGITFKIKVNDTVQIEQGTRMDVSIDIFNAAGEKVLAPELQDSIWDDLGMPLYSDSVMWTWNLTNNKGKVVAPGVYVAIVRLVVPELNVDETKKYKLAVIR